ncbi:Filament-like plant protein 6 [Capsicum chinense]|nr:Filament-like plant protein 6 [Capsicum chinense]
MKMAMEFKFHFLARLFKKNCFGRFLGLPEDPLSHFRFSMMMVYDILKCKIKYVGNDKDLEKGHKRKMDKICINYCGMPVCFGLQEFTIVMGLRCHRPEELPPCKTSKTRKYKEKIDRVESFVCGVLLDTLVLERVTVMLQSHLTNLDQQLLRSAAENSALSRSCKQATLEGVKKVAKLEAECRRLHGLVQKKLPGPTGLAQMKLEVESLGRDYGDSRVKKSQGGRPSLPDFSLDSVQKFHRENEQLTERLLAMEEETKMMKEALAHRNSELQTSRSICAKTASKLQNLEAQLQANAEQKSRQKSTIRRQHSEGSFTHETNHLPRLASMSEDGNDDNVSCSSSWTTALMSELSHVKKEKNFDIFSHLDLMDDFLEMEKLAYQSSDTNGTVLIPDNSK